MRIPLRHLCRLSKTLVYCDTLFALQASKQNTVSRVSRNLCVHHTCPVAVAGEAPTTMPCPLRQVTSFTRPAPGRLGRQQRLGRLRYERRQPVVQQVQACVHSRESACSAQDREHCWPPSCPTWQLPLLPAQKQAPYWPHQDQPARKSPPVTPRQQRARCWLEAVHPASEVWLYFVLPLYQSLSQET